jgi:hypothetical protein
MEGPLEQVLKHPKSPDGPDFIDAAASGFTYDTLDYLQCPTETEKMRSNPMRTKMKTATR